MVPDWTRFVVGGWELCTLGSGSLLRWCSCTGYRFFGRTVGTVYWFGCWGVSGRCRFPTSALSGALYWWFWSVLDDDGDGIWVGDLGEE